MERWSAGGHPGDTAPLDPRPPGPEGEEVSESAATLSLVESLVANQKVLLGTVMEIQYVNPPPPLPRVTPCHVLPGCGWMWKCVGGGGVGGCA